MSDGLKVPDELKQTFDELHASNLALQFKSDCFSRTINAEAMALAVTTRSTWEETKAVMNLQGDWRYENGMVFPAGPQNV